MPEETRRGGDAAGRIWIRRAGTPAAGPQRLARAAAAESDRENVPPAGYAAGTTWRRMARKSPLPEWYPRTPLRDITAIVNALERRRLRVQAARAAQANNRDNEANPQTTVPPSPSQEQIDSSETLPINSTSDPAPACSAPFLSPIEHPLQLSSGSSSFSPTGYNAHPNPSISGDLTPRNTQLTANEEKLCNSIGQIEKIVKKNLKRTTKKEPAAKRATQRRTLMSMR